MFLINHVPAITNPSTVTGGLLQVRTGTAAAAETLRGALAGASPGRSGPTWTVQRLGGAGVLSWSVGTLAPGIRPLNDSAHWPGAAPPASALASWAAARGLNPFAVARMLKRRGGFAAAYGGRYESFVERVMIAQHSRVAEQVQREGVRLLLERLSATHG